MSVYGHNQDLVVNHDKWKFRNEKVEEDMGPISMSKDAYLPGHSVQYVWQFAPGGYHPACLYMTQMPSNCGSLLAHGFESWGQPKQVMPQVDLVARNYASLNGHNVICVNGHETWIKALIDLDTGWKLDGTVKSPRTGWRSNISYAHVELSRSDMIYIGG